MSESEYLVYYDGSFIHLHHIQSKTNVKTIPIDFVPENYALTDDDTSTIFTFQDGQLIIVTDKNGRSSSIWSYQFVIIRLDRHFNLLSSQPYPDDQKAKRPVKILEEHLGCISFNEESVFYQFKGSKDKLPYNIPTSNNDYYKSKYFTPAPTVGSFCYDPFDDAIVITLKSMPGTSPTKDARCFEIWKKRDAVWKLDRGCGLLEPFNVLDADYLAISRLQCTKQFIIVMMMKNHQMYTNKNKQIVVIDKYKLEVVNVIEGLQVSYCCGYDWDKKLLGVLVEINEMKGLCLDLLKLILLYTY